MREGQSDGDHNINRILGEGGVTILITYEQSKLVLCLQKRAAAPKMIGQPCIKMNFYSIITQDGNEN